VVFSDLESCSVLGPFDPSCCNQECLSILWFELSSICLTNLLESCYALNTKVEQNVTITALTKIQHFCIKNERTTEFSVSVGRLPNS
jgi:hypothetical protein